MPKSKYYEDKRKEELFGEWLDIHYYSKYKQRYKEIKRCYDSELQHKGVDVIITTFQDNTIYVDEKATLHYINRRIPTFAFEIRNDASGARGWLYNPDYLTDYYLLAWPDASDERVRDVNDFTRAEIMSIKRDNVVGLLADKGLSEENIIKMIPHYKNKLSMEHNKFEVADGIKINFNLTLAERPINITIRKELLKERANLFTIIP